MNKSDDQLVEEIFDLFESNDERLLLITTDNSVYGDEELVGLRLVANCLWQAFEMETAKELENNRLAEIRAALNQIAKKKYPSWVLCYHLAGTEYWGLATSKKLSLAGAAQEMLTFVRIGILMEDTLSRCLCLDTR
jgi:hypothetical protein